MVVHCGYFCLLGPKLAGGDEIMDMAMNVYGKPTHAQHVYLPYYQGQMQYTRKSKAFYLHLKIQHLNLHVYTLSFIHCTVIENYYILHKQQCLSTLKEKNEL